MRVFMLLAVLALGVSAAAWAADAPSPQPAVPAAPARSEAQIAASRENGAKSQDPRDTTNTRHNAVKHGILSDVVYCKDDSERTAFEALLAGLTDEYAPQTQSEAFYTERIAHCMWKMRTLEMRIADRPGIGTDALPLIARYDRHISQELTQAETKLRQLQSERMQQECLLDETNPSLSSVATGHQTCPSLSPVATSHQTCPPQPSAESPDAARGAGNPACRPLPSGTPSIPGRIPQNRPYWGLQQPPRSRKDPQATAAESLRRVTRIFELAGQMTEQDRAALKAAAHNHLQTYAQAA